MESLTDKNYWGERQNNLGVDVPNLDKPISYIINKIIPFLKEYENGTFLELGCSPGYMSYYICERVNIKPYGVDFSEQAYLYEKCLKQLKYCEPVLYKEDILHFRPTNLFDVVASFGLIEHFKDT